MQPIPIFIPTPPPEPPKCPHCHQPEDIQWVCAHCGYIYPEEENDAILWPWITLYVLGWLGTWAMGIWWSLKDKNSWELAHLDMVQEVMGVILAGFIALVWPLIWMAIGITKLALWLMPLLTSPA